MADASAEPASSVPPKVARTPKCSRCRNHGLLVPVRGHSGRCARKFCTCPKCSLISERAKILAAHKQLRKSAPQAESAAPEGGEGGNSKAATGAGSHKEIGQAVVKYSDIGPPPHHLECMPNMEYFERETSRIYPAYPPMCTYPPFSMGLKVAPPGYGGAIPPMGIPFPGIRQCHPIPDARRDFQHGYFPSVPQFMPPGFLHGTQYHPVPMSAVGMAEFSREVSGMSTVNSQSFMMIPEKSQGENKEPSI
eukprot:XP_002931473.1 PREDICTED: doublesex- and mab-3-related transcription factor B1 [Xenopus tropicalis]